RQYSKASCHRAQPRSCRRALQRIDAGRATGRNGHFARRGDTALRRHLPARRVRPRGDLDGRTRTTARWSGAMLAQRTDSIDSQPEPARSVIFISHATPEDNAFATWLATQLAVAGYAVWCDTTKLLGGEPFWKDITEAIERHAF